MTEARAVPRRPWRPADLLPPADSRDGALVFVVAVLVFLACLTAVAALAANRAAAGWQSELAGSATLLVRPKPGETADAAAARAAEAASGVRGVVQAAALEKEKAEALLEPWLGKDFAIDDLPAPRLVALELDRKAPATAAELDKALKAAGIDATVDDHSLWLRDIMHAGRLARLGALLIFALLAAATAAVIAFATRAALEARRDLVEVLHLSGAEPSFIAGLFQVRFAKMAAIAGVIGTLAAILIGIALKLTGGGAGLTPVLPIAWGHLLAPSPAPLLAAATAALAARYSALSLLKIMS